jgi:hypothetical protein
LVLCSLTEESKKPPEDAEQGNKLVHKELKEECGRETEEGIMLPAFCNSCGTWPVGKPLAGYGTVGGTGTEVTLICGWGT